MGTETRCSVVGRVVGLWRYPVKSMAAEALTEAQVAWHGIAGDRRWAFVREGMQHSVFPWLTLRQRPNMNHYRPWLCDRTKPETSPTTVQTPTGATLDIADPALAAELCPDGGARVIRQSRGIFDTFPLSLITTQSIVQLGNTAAGQQLDVQRFRPNILVQASHDTPFVEDAWVGRTLQLGTIRMRIDKRDGRCVVITIDPVTMQRNAAILRAVAQQRQACLGVYGSTVQPGRVAVNDDVLIEPAT